MSVNKTLWQNEDEKNRGTTKFLAVALVIVLIFSALIYVYSSVIVHVLVKGDSMKNTLFDGEVVSINTKKQADYGDIIVIKNQGSNWLIKRLIAKGGDEVMISNGYVFVNGEKLNEPYLREQGITYYPDCTDKFHLELLKITVPQGEIFFLGDNRTSSSDSRDTDYLTTSEENVVGVVTPFLLKIKNVSKRISGLSNSVKEIFS